MTPPPETARRAPAVVIVLLLAILGAVMTRNRGPEVRPASAPATVFSAERAMRFHRDVIGDVPHPVGSAAHDEVLSRLVAQFRTLGYDTSIQRTFACNPSAMCSMISNVIARRGGASGDTLLLAAHYDSVPAGPGASDDGLGVATMLEVARAIRDQHLRNPITFLISDAEEAGLIGAEAFVADPNVAGSVAAVVNVEARGTSGTSFLFETSRHNRWLLPIVARTLPRPATSSLFFNIYELLPNDTDLTVFKRAGYAGVNFANIGNVAGYHTPNDNFAHLSPRLLQHDGDHVLAMARALGDAELRQTSDDNAVWFDVLQFTIIWWPQRWSFFVSLLMLVILLVAAAVRIRDAKTTPAFITAGVVSFFISLFGAFLLGVLAMWIAGLRSLGAVWVAQPGPAIAAMWLLGIGAAIVTAQQLYAHAGFDGLFLGHAICWCTISIALSLVLPGGSYLTIVPATALAVSAIVRAAREADEGSLVIVCGAIAAALHFPLALTLYDALGQPSLPIIACDLALVSTTFVPLIAAADLRRALVHALFGATIVCVLMALFLPPYTTESPRRLSLRYVDDGKSARWQADALTPALSDAAPFDLKPVSVYEWLKVPVRVWQAPAQPIALPPAEVRVIGDVRGARRQLSLLIRSARGAQRLAFTYRAPSLESIRINGVTPAPPTSRTRKRDWLVEGWHRATVRGATEARIDLVLRDNAPIDVIVSDATPGLPPSGAPIVAARDRSAAVASDDGDSTVTMRRARL